MTHHDVITMDDAACVPAPPAPVSEAGAIVSMIERAARDPSVDIEKIERLWKLHQQAQDRAEDREARRAFNEAIANAKAEIGPIQKNKHVGFESRRIDSKTDYWHETFASVATAVDPVLSRHGLSYRFRSVQDGAKLRVTCILSHRGGYSEETVLECGNDTSGNKNAIQAIGSAATYLQRYTLKLALGLSAAEKDDDGKASNPSAEPDTISPQQLAQLQYRIRELGADAAAFRNALGVESFADIYADKFTAALGLLNQMAARRAK